MFQGVFEGGLENVSLHFEGILKTLPTETTPGGRSATNLRGGPKKCSLYFGTVPPEKWPSRGGDYIYIPQNHQYSW